MIDKRATLLIKMGTQAFGDLLSWDVWSQSHIDGRGSAADYLNYGVVYGPAYRKGIIYMLNYKTRSGKSGIFRRRSSVKVLVVYINEKKIRNVIHPSNVRRNLRVRKYLISIHDVPNFVKS